MISAVLITRFRQHVELFLKCEKAKVKQRYYYIIPWLVLSFIRIHGQAFTRIVNPSSGFGAYSRVSGDVMSLTSNQARLSGIKEPALGIYGERRFFQSDLSHYLVMAAWITAVGNFSLGLSTAGTGAYRETKFSVGAARRLGARLDVGIGFRYNTLGIASYGSASAITATVACILYLSETLQVGFQVVNAGGGRYGSLERLGSIYSGGFGYDVSEKFYFGGEVIKEEGKNVCLQAGCHYQVISRLFVRAGIATGSSSVWMGVGIHVLTGRVDVTAAWHPLLGVTPGLGFNFRMVKRKTE
ncbi:MAG: hypothetical protein H7Y42_12545 [Chitinophagaceae bacterium]|nr:hypothetical protein [Chitinophagaceae bacterium]